MNDTEAFTLPDGSTVVVHCDTAFARYVSWVRRLGLGFHPDTRGDGYSPPLDAAARRDYEEAVEAAFAAGAPDPYDLALAVWRKDGLLGPLDVGPKAFREAARAAKNLPQPPGPNPDPARPRLDFRELLDAVSEFDRATHPVRINVRTHGTFDAMDAEFAAHRDRLVAWFAARGVDVS